MQLNYLQIKNYRSCRTTEVRFAPHLTLLVGENDAGKSNIIDAIRSSIPAVAERQGLWFSQDRDHTYQATPKDNIVITRLYGDLSVGEAAYYTPSLVDGNDELVHTTEYTVDPAIARRLRVSHTVGKACVPDPEPENRSRIAHIYLPALRDATQALDSPSGSRLTEVIRLLATTEEIDAFVTTANDSLSALAGDVIPKRVVKSVQAHLTSVTEPVRRRTVHVMHRGQRLESLTRALRLHMAAAGISPADLLGTGLGYANLLYIATVVLELEKAHEHDLVLLLVEEPEAHLHPQLQSVLLDYLKEQAEQSASRTVAAGECSGRIQVIATSHSPHLASSLSTRNIVVARSIPCALDKRISGSADPPPLPLSTSHNETTTISLADVKLTDRERRKIDRYLNATRAGLLFARQVILVEGVAEAMLLRSLADCLVFPRSKDGPDIDGLRNARYRNQFRAITIVPIDGVDFLPYARLLLGVSALVDKLVVVTDGDAGAGERRRTELLKEFPDHAKSGCLSVCVGGTTLEAELFGPKGNEQILREAFRVQHPLSLEKWDAIAGVDHDTDERARKFSVALKEKTIDLGKGDFAQVVAELLAKDIAGTFCVPGYLTDAIKASIIIDADTPQADDHDSE